MALLTERALKRHNAAVITVESPRATIAKGGWDVDFEWFKTPEAADAHAKQWTEFCAEDVVAYDIDDGDDTPMAYMTIVIDDTADIHVSDSFVFPNTDVTSRWMEDILADISVLFEKQDEPKKAKVVIKARRKASFVGGSEN